MEDTNAQKLNKNVFSLVLMPDKKPLEVTALQRKLFNTMIKTARESEPFDRGGDSGPGWYKITLTQIGEKLGLPRQEVTAKYYKEACRQLMSHVVIFTPPSARDDSIEQLALPLPQDTKSTADPDVIYKETSVETKLRHLIDKVDIIEPKNGQHYIYYKLDSQVGPHLLRTDLPYAQINLGSVAKLTSVHSIALYEIAVRFKSTGSTGLKPWTWWVEAITGMPTTGAKRSKTYDEFRYFNARVIQPAMEEIEKTDIRLTLKKDAPRNTREIGFEVTLAPETSQPKSEVEIKEEDPRVVAVKARATDRGITQVQIDRLLKRYGPQNVEHTLELLDRAIYQREQDHSLNPIRSNHAFVDWILKRMSADGTGTIAPEKKTAAPRAQDGLAAASFRPAAASSQETTLLKTIRAICKQEIMEMRTTNSRAMDDLAKRAIDVLDSKNKVFPAIRRSFEQKNYTGFLLTQMIETHAFETRGVGPDQLDTETTEGAE